MGKGSDSIRACSIELGPAVARVKAASKLVSKSADELKCEARQASIDSNVRRGTPPRPFPGVHSTREVREETPFSEAPTARFRQRS